MKKKLRVALIIGAALALILVTGIVVINVYVNNFSEKYINNTDTAMWRL